MPDAPSHGPGHAPTEGGLRQHQMNARGDGPMPGGNFGVEPERYPGRRAMNAPGGPATGEILKDSERAGPPNIMLKPEMMTAQAHSQHGPHAHPPKLRGPEKKFITGRGD